MVAYHRFHYGLVSGWLDQLTQDVDKFVFHVIANRAANVPDRSDFSAARLKRRSFDDRKLATFTESLRKFGFEIVVYPDTRTFIDTALNDGIKHPYGRIPVVYDIGTPSIGPGHRALLPAFCIWQGLHYCGSNPAARALCWNKITATRVLRQVGVPTPASWLYRRDGSWDFNMSPPDGTRVIVKTNYEAYAVGVGKDSVFDWNSKSSHRVQKISDELQQDVIVQEFIPGDEVDVPVLRSSEYYVSSPVILEYKDRSMGPNSFLSHDQNTGSSAIMFTAYTTDLHIDQILREYAAIATEALQITGIARMDFRITRDGKPFIFDMAETPTLSNYHAVAQSLESDGLPENYLIPLIIYVHLNNIGLISCASSTQ